MDTVEALSRQIRVNDTMLQSLREKLGNTPSSDPNRWRLVNEIDRIAQAQNHFWNRLLKLRVSEHHEFPDDYGPPEEKPGIPLNPAPPKPIKQKTWKAAGPEFWAPFTVTGDKSATFQIIVSGFMIDGTITVTGSVTVKPKGHIDPQNFSVDQSDATTTGEVVMSNALASAKGSVSYDSSTGLLDASISSSLSALDGTVSFSQSVSLTGGFAGPTLRMSIDPKPIKGSTAKSTIEGQIGMTIEAHIRPIGGPVPFPVPRTVPNTRPVPSPIPVNSPVSPILVPWKIFKEAAGLEDPPSS